MPLDVSYCRNGWNGRWEIVSTNNVIFPVGHDSIYSGALRLAPSETKFTFKGIDPRQQRLDSFRCMFSLVDNGNDLEIRWGGDADRAETIHFSAGPADVLKVILTIDVQKIDGQTSGMLGVIIDDGNIGKGGMIWKNYYDKFPPTAPTALGTAPTATTG